MEALSALNVPGRAFIKYSHFYSLNSVWTLFLGKPEKDIAQENCRLAAGQTVSRSFFWLGQLSHVTPGVSLSSPVTTLLLSFKPSLTDCSFQHPLCVWSCTAPKVTPSLPSPEMRVRGFFLPQNLWTLRKSCQIPEEGCR